MHPFLFDLKGETEVRLNWEDTDLAWVEPDGLAGLVTVPKLAEALRACA